MRRLAMGLAVVMMVGIGIASAQQPTQIPLSGGVLVQKTTPSLTPSAISAATCAGGLYIYCSTTETFTVTGLHTSDTILAVSPPYSSNWPVPSMCQIIGADVSANDTLRLRFAVLTTAACTPTPGTHTIYTIRVNP